MENLLESNERTLVIFDAVCAGLAECLELVHADIKLMTEHRNQLAQQVEHDQQQQRQKLAAVELQASNRGGRYAETDLNGASPRGVDSPVQSTDLDRTITSGENDAAATSPAPVDDEDPHHLARLKLLDKRLADSFSQALSMCDQQKSSLVKSQQQRQVAAAAAAAAGQQARPSILQLLLGKGRQERADKSRARATEQRAKEGPDRETAGRGSPDARLVIDDMNRQTRLAMQYSKQLEANLLRVEDLRAKYEMHLKMGLVVRSVSRAYLTNHHHYAQHQPHTQTLPHNYGGGGGTLHAHAPASAAASPSIATTHSASSLGRPRRAHHLSTVVVNDSSSLGTTTRSSLSSLNLSTWSFSRRQQQQSDRSARQRSEHASPGAHAHGPVGPPGQHPLDQSYVSTISLDSTRRQGADGRDVSQTISPGRAHVRVSSPPPPLPACGASYVDQQYQLLYGGGGGGGGGGDQFAPGCQLAAPECNCGLIDASDAAGTPSIVLDAFDGARHQRAHSRPLSQYVYGSSAEFATPTTMGTLASHGAGEKLYAAGGNGGSLHKSASHSSLRKVKSSSMGGSSFYPSAKSSHLHGGGGGGSKTTIKEFIDNIERIESELESYMGSLLMNIEDIQGFARVCQGDVFEISVRYGHAQKFKTRISVLKDNRQRCVHRQTVFKARIADVIAIKAYECKGLGKKHLLGHKLCETRDLFVARSQLLTISLNQTGSIKLNLVITWNPLHMTPNSSLASSPGLDISHISLLPPPPPMPVAAAPVGVMTPTGARREPRQDAAGGLARRPLQSSTPAVGGAAPDAASPCGYYIPEPDYNLLASEIK